MRRRFALFCLVFVFPLALFAMGAKPFVLLDEYSSDLTGTVHYTYEHVKTGFTVVYEHNEVGDNYAQFVFLTPMQNESDCNHILEHSLASGSEKYESSYLYFDMHQRGYFSSLNAMTSVNYTYFYGGSESAKQMEIYIDALMSIISSADIARNENIFKREAIRFDLFSKDDPIVATGTVFNEDLGYITDATSAVFTGIAKTLYPDTNYSRINGRLPLNLEDCTYENLLKVYYDYYNWDNCFLYLYGDLDIEKILNLLDSEYLSKVEKKKTDLSPYDEKVGEGLKEAYFPIAAPSSYKRVEGDTYITYTFDVSDFTAEEYYAIGVLLSELDKDGGIIKEELKRHGVDGNFEYQVNYGIPRPHIIFMLSSTEESEKDDFKKAIESVIDRASRGETDRKSARKQAESIKKEIRYSSEIGMQARSNAYIYTDLLSLYNRHDAIKLYESAINSVIEEEDFSYLFSALREESRLRSLVVSFPEAGLYDEIIENIDNYLKEMKDSMSDEELDNLIKETEEYYEWVKQSQVNNDIMIDKDDVEDRYLDIEIEEVKRESGTYESIDVEGTDTLLIEINFPLSHISRSDLDYLALYHMILPFLDTPSFSHSEILDLTNEYFYSLEFVFSVYDEMPYFTVSAELDKDDIEQAIALIEEILMHSEITKEIIKTHLPSEREYYNLGRRLTEFGNSTRLSPLLASKSGLYEIDLFYDGFYDYSSYVLDNLDDEEFSNNLIENLERISSLIFRKGNVKTLVIGEEENNAIAISEIDEFLSKLDEEGEKEEKYEFLALDNSIALITNDSTADLFYILPIDEAKEIKGSYITYLKALESDVLTPLRTAGGAYTAGTTINIPLNIMMMNSISNSNVSKTLETFLSAFETYKAFDRGELDLSSSALAILSNSSLDYSGKLSGAHDRYTLLLRYGKERGEDLLNGVKNTVLSEKEEALDALSRAFKEHGTLIYSGPDAMLSPIREHFSTVIDLT